jgi:hypothetical protein
VIGVEVGVGVEVELEVLDLLAGAAKTEVLARERRKRKIDENFILVTNAVERGGGFEARLSTEGEARFYGLGMWG